MSGGVFGDGGEVVGECFKVGLQRIDFQNAGVEGGLLTELNGEEVAGSFVKFIDLGFFEEFGESDVFGGLLKSLISGGDGGEAVVGICENTLAGEFFFFDELSKIGGDRLDAPPGFISTDGN